MTEPNPDLAACKGMPNEIFFPKKEVGGAAEPAKKICAQCPALVDCLLGAIERNEGPGIWGGAGEDKRRNLRRKWLAGKNIPEVWENALLEHIMELDGVKMPIRDRNGPKACCGLRSTYNRGCRCVADRWAAADDVQARSKRKAPTVTKLPDRRLVPMKVILDDVEHGLLSSYEAGCRCQVCEWAFEDAREAGRRSA